MFVKISLRAPVGLLVFLLVAVGLAAAAPSPQEEQVDPAAIFTEEEVKVPVAGGSCQTECRLPCEGDSKHDHILSLDTRI